MVGTILGHYRIERALGSGGMGDVYLAEDSTLNRKVALKVLSARIAADPEFIRRFKLEAQAVAAINHPGIVTIHSVEEADGVRFLTMELVEGRLLSAVIPKEGLPLAQVLDVAIQLADALDAAHRRGIVHRDIKPGNIIITASGVKVLDFGLAKLCERGISGAGEGQSMTATGLIVGTPQYMAPEQIDGRSVDHRADIFALGSVIYEMASGRRAFEAESAAGAMANVLTREPPAIAQIRGDLPPMLDAVVRKCLAKPPDERWQSVRDVRDLLRGVRDGAWLAAPGQRAPAVVEPGARFRSWLLATIALLVGAGVAIPAVLRLRRPAEAPIWAQAPIRFTVTTGGSVPAISHDGRYLAYVTSPPNTPAGIWVRGLADAEARLLPGTAGATNPFWAPDGRAIAFHQNGALKRVDLSGGSPQTLWNVPVGTTGSWGSSGVIVFALRQVLYQIPETGGSPTAVTTLDLSRQENSHRFPHFLPDGRRFLFVARSGRPENCSVYLASLDGPQPTRLFQTLSTVRYAAPGYLLFERDDTLLAQPFDAAAGRLTGEAVTVVSPVGGSNMIGPGLAGSYAVSDGGVLAYRASSEPPTQLTWIDRGGRIGPSVGEPGIHSYFRISPDERRVAFDLADHRLGSRSIWTLDLATSARTRLTFPGSDDWIPVWSPDASQMLFSSWRDGPSNLYQKPVSGAGGDRPVFVSSDQKFAHDWSPDGQFIAYMEGNREQELDVLVRRLDGSGPPISIAQTNAIEYYPRFSPDGRWIAYGSGESGTNEVYVKPFPPTGGKWQISSGGGTLARWRGDGRELFYLRPDRSIMAVDVSTPSSSFAVGPPRVVFRVEGARVDSASHTYEVTRDGQRFLVNMFRPAPPDRGITVVLNWMAALRR